MMEVMGTVKTFQIIFNGINKMKSVWIVSMISL